MSKELKEYAEGLPERRKNPDWHEELKRELSEHADRIEGRLRRFFSRALAAFAIMGLASAVALLGFGLVLKNQAHTASDIQKQRFELIRDTCLDQNDRNHEALNRIDTAVAQIPPGPQHRRAEKSAQPFKLIISAAVPYTPDCVKYAHNRVKEN